MSPVVALLACLNCGDRLGFAWAILVAGVIHRLRSCSAGPRHDTVWVMTFLHAARFVAFASLVLAIPRSVAADCSSPVALSTGFLGSELEQAYHEFVDHGILRVPRNVAIYKDRRTGTPTGLPFQLVELGVQGLWRPETTLPPETQIVYWRQTAITTTEIDTQPPTGVRLVEAFDDGCGLMLPIEGSPADDQTPTDRLTYVVHAGSTAEEAATTSMPHALVPALNVSEGRDSDRLFVYFSGRSDSRWFAVSVLDLAGNESTRSEAVELIGSSGCEAADMPRAGSTSLAMVGFLAFFAVWTRGRKNRKRSQTRPG